MKYYLLVLLFAGLSIGCSSNSKNLADPGTEEFNDFAPKLTIVYSANVEGEIEPCGCRSNPTGGLTRRNNLLNSDLIKQPRLSVDSGDLLFKSTPAPPFLLKQWLYQASVIIEAYNQMAMDAVVPGELDFAAGTAEFKKITQKAKFPFIAANLFYKNNQQPLLKPYVVIQKGSQKIGLLGLVDETLSYSDDLRAESHLAIAQKLLPELKRQADVVILLTHLGLTKDLELAQKLSGVAAIFGGHSQSFLSVPEKVNHTLIFQPSFRGQHLGVYEGGHNKLFQVDSRFDGSANGKKSSIDLLVEQSKTEINRINLAAEQELFQENHNESKSNVEFQTFAQCAQCHSAQFNFHQKTPHFKAFATLVNAKQAGNLECLKCHTVGANARGGWNQLKNLVLNKKGQAIDAKNFALALPQLSAQQVTQKVNKAYLNVQCENCHGVAPEHPFATNRYSVVKTSTCLQCHTADQAPTWYLKNGQPNLPVIEQKLKSMTCPKAI